MRGIRLVIGDGLWGYPRRGQTLFRRVFTVIHVQGEEDGGGGGGVEDQEASGGGDDESDDEG